MGGDEAFRILAGVDGSAPSRLALEWAVTEARLRHGQVRAVTAWQFPPTTVGMEGLIRDPDVFPQAARRLQNETLQRVDSEGVTATGDVVQGHAADVLLRAAEDADLLVVGPVVWADSPECCWAPCPRRSFITRPARSSWSGHGPAAGNERPPGPRATGAAKATAVTGDHASHLHPPAGPRRGTVPARTVRGRLQSLWHTVVGAVGLVMGLLPHVLHHIGLLAGTALVAGSGGTALFGTLGLLASIPMLIRLYRRFGSWVAPVLGLLVFAAMFSLSAFVIGPAISGTGGDVTPSPTPTVVHTDHPGH